MSGSRILITGGSGFVGSRLALRFAANGHKPVCFDNLSRAGSEILLSEIRDAGCEFVEGDIRNPGDLDRIEGHLDLLIDCSAEPSIMAGTSHEGAQAMMQTNVTGSTHLFAFALRRTLPVIFMSTSRVYPYDLVNDCRYRELPTRFELERGNDDISHHGVKTSLRIQGPKTLYGATKLACELLLQELATQFDLPVLINRCGVISGPGQLGKIDQGIFAFWLFCHHWQKPLSYIGFGGQGKQVRDVLHCEDLADLIMIQSRRIEEFRGQVFNAGGGRHSSLSLAEATVLCREITGHKSPITQEPRNRPGDIKWYLSHNADAEREFGWQPRRNPEIVLRDTYEWLLEHELELGRLLG